MMPKQCCQGHQDPLRTACAALAIALTMAHPVQAFTSTGYVPPPANQQMGVDDQVTTVMCRMRHLAAINSMHCPAVCTVLSKFVAPEQHASHALPLTGQTLATVSEALCQSCRLCLPMTAKVATTHVQEPGQDGPVE